MISPAAVSEGQACSIDIWGADMRKIWKGSGNCEKLQLNLFMRIVEVDAENKPRCPGDYQKDPLYLKYHDKEWGRPCHDETDAV